MKLTLLITLSTLCIAVSYAQPALDEAIDDVLPDVLKKHREFVSIPNVASDEANMLRNLEWAKIEFEKLDFKVRFLESSTLPVFLAERNTHSGVPTILFYLHIDGQPVDPDNWDQEDPFVPVLKQQGEDGEWEIIDYDLIDQRIDPEWRIFARAAADDKAPIIMLLTALDLLRNQGQELAYNVKVVLDPEEEAGSRAFKSTLEKYKKRYAADYLIIMDGPAHPSNKPTLTLGCRGMAGCSITLYGAKLPQHSGHFGNYAPNPVFAMAHLLASMKDENGLVTIDGFYDGIEISSEVERFLNQVPDDDSRMLEELGIYRQDQVGPGYQKALQYPSLNVRHIETSWKGPGLKTIIPEIITAHMDVRLVKETDGSGQLKKIRRHLESQGFLVLDDLPTDQQRLEHPKIATFKAGSGSNAFRTEVDAPIVRRLAQALETAHGEAPILIRTMGGTVPIIKAIEILGIEAVIVPMVNMDNNQHNPNENIRIGNIKDGIKTCIAILSMRI